MQINSMVMKDQDMIRTRNKEIHSTKEEENVVP